MKKGVLLVLIIFLSCTQVLMAQTREVSGTVTSAEDGGTIPGVSISVKGTSLGTITNIDGYYVLKVPSNATTLVFSFVGMNTVELPITGNTVNVEMNSDVIGVEEVVVTALGIKRESKSVGFAVQNVGSEDLMKTGASDFAKAIQGKVAGVDVKMTSGMPGASSQVVIRGARSFTGDNTPLYVVDGMPISSTPSFNTFNSVTGADISNRAIDINPNDIESINVLKGQAAAALYGIRASNGVILITTKSGKGGPKGKPVVTINQTTSFETVSRTPDYQQTYAQGIGGTYNPTSSMSWGPKIVDLPDDPARGGNANGHPGLFYVPQLEQGGLDPWVAPKVYNNWDDYFKVGYTSTTSANVSVAEENGTYSLGIGYTDQDGIALNTGMQRWNAKANADRKLNKNFSTGFSANFSKTEIDKLTGANDGSLAGVLAAPISYNLKGYPYHVPGDPYSQIYYRALSFDNPYWIEHHNTFNEKTNRFFGNGFVDYKTSFAQDMNLTVKYQLGIDTYNTYYQDIFGYGRKDGAGEIDNYGITETTYNSLLTAAYDWKINDALQLNVIAGNEFNHNKRYTWEQYGTEFNFGGWNHVENAKTVVASENQRQDRTIGTFYSVELSFKDMIFFTTTGRNDIVSTMPRGSRSFFYPSVGLGIVLSELDFIKEMNWLNFAKIRGSFAEVGQAGRYLPNNYERPNYGGGFWTAAPIQYPMDGVSSYIQNTTLYDPALKPQNTKSLELGLNLKMLNNRLGIDYNYSNQKIEDQIFTVPLAGSTGARNLLMNGGSVTTNVHEIMLYLTPISTKNFTWDISVNLSKMKNYVDELAPGVESISLGGFVTPQVRAGIGNTYPVIYGDQYLKNDKGQILVNEDPNSASYGMPMVGSPGVLGEVTPDYIVGVTTDLTYKNLSLGLVFETKQGGHMYSGSNGLLDLYGMSERTGDRESTFIFKGYKADGTPNDIARGGPNDPGAVQTLYNDILTNIDEYYVYGNSFIKLREASIKYRLPKNMIPKVNIAISAFARNILLWTELPNFDPESSQGNNNMAGGFERFSLPNATSLGFGVEVKF